MTKLQANTIIELLREIRDDLRVVLHEPSGVEHDEPPAGPQPCTHPEKTRLDMSTIGETEWECRAILADGRTCKYRYGPVSKKSVG